MKYFLLFSFLFSSSAISAQPKPKVVFECTVEYSVNNDEETKDEALKHTAVVLYIKHHLSRVDFMSPSFTQKKFFDSRKGTAVILQEMGSTKVMRNIDSLKWLAMNKRFDSALIRFANEKKTILDYTCSKATVSLKDGTVYNLFYATQIIPSFTAYEYQFKDIPGFVLEYETVEEGSGKKVRYTASKINFSPVPASKFELPKGGYRIL